MRDYLYLWHDPATARLIASGVEFRDIVPHLADVGGIVLLRHTFAEARFDAASRFDFVPHGDLAQLAADDVHSYGDFCWADFGPDTALADLTDEAVAELTFFAHKARPLRAVAIPSLANAFLCWAHDDGWYAAIYYVAWPSVERMLGALLVQFLAAEDVSRALTALRSRPSAYWVTASSLFECQQSDDIDALQARYWHK